jgi:hypothetical protein
VLNSMSGNQGPEGLNQDDRDSVDSFRELSKMHRRKKNFLELRLRDPESLYEVDEVKMRMKPKKQALNEQKLIKKGMMRKEKSDAT